MTPLAHPQYHHNTTLINTSPSPPNQALHYSHPWETLPLPPRACCSRCVSWTCGSGAWCPTPCLGSTHPLQHHPRKCKAIITQQADFHVPIEALTAISFSLTICQNNTDLKDKFKSFCSHGYQMNKQTIKCNSVIIYVSLLQCCYFKYAVVFKHISPVTNFGLKQSQQELLFGCRQMPENILI